MLQQFLWPAKRLGKLTGKGLAAPHAHLQCEQHAAKHMRILAPIILAFVDALVTLTSLVLAIWIRDTILPAIHVAPAFQPVRDYGSLWPGLLLVVAARGAVGLYPGYGRTAPEELRLQTLSTLFVLAFVFAGAALFRFNATYSRFVLTGTAALLLLTLPLSRSLAKHVMSRFRFFGWSVVVLGRGSRTATLRSLLASNRTLGLRPVDDSRPGKQADICLLVPDNLTAPLPDMLYELGRRYRRVLLAPDLLDISSVWVTPRDVGGHLALELRNNLLMPGNRILKRILDVGLAAIVSVISCPAMLMIAAMILASSPGPVLVRQRRVGKDGKDFWVYKFRTMHRDAHEHLKAILQNDDAARREWEATRKLKNDPRVTTIGRFLRASSLDELPQLFSVVKGDMSLVGPRPIVRDELEMYRERSRLYLDVRPGLTGLMQVSGRNDLPYEQRVRLDAYYVRNWSVWIDLVILARTVVAVVRGDGAY